MNLRLGFKDKSILMFSDSQAAIRALSAKEFSSRLVWACYAAISIPWRRRKQVVLIWVPGYIKICVNEAAAVLANWAAATVFMGPEQS